MSNALTIVLEGGYGDGKEFTISDDVWDRGTVIVPAYGPHGYTHREVYQRRRYLPENGWICMMPLYRWMWVSRW